MVSNVNIVGVDRESVKLSAAPISWAAGAAPSNTGNIANREVIRLSNFTTVSTITLNTSAKTGSTSLAVMQNMSMLPGAGNLNITGRSTSVSDRTEIIASNFEINTFLMTGGGYVRKFNSVFNVASTFSITGVTQANMLYYARDCEDYGAVRTFSAVNAWYMNCITSASNYQASLPTTSSITFNACSFNTAAVGLQVSGTNPTSHYFIRNCTIRQNMIGGVTPCDRDTWEFPNASVDTGVAGTTLTFTPPFISTNYFVTMTAEELTHTCPVVIIKNTGNVVVRANGALPQPWSVLITLLAASSAAPGQPSLPPP
jgi:hypothetical protein